MITTFGVDALHDMPTREQAHRMKPATHISPRRRNRAPFDGAKNTLDSLSVLWKNSRIEVGLDRFKNFKISHRFQSAPHFRMHKYEYVNGGSP
jgi:hypothetical protein